MSTVLVFFLSTVPLSKQIKVKIVAFVLAEKKCKKVKTICVFFVLLFYKINNELDQNAQTVMPVPTTRPLLRSVGQPNIGRSKYFTITTVI